jgi:hypothetical protein
MLNPDTGELGTLPDGYGNDTEVEEQDITAMVWGDIMAAEEPASSPRIALFSQLDYTFIDRATGRTLATRSVGTIGTAVESWAEAGNITIRGAGQLYLRNPPLEVPYEALDQSRLVNPRTRRAEPYTVDDPARVMVVEYLSVWPVYGEERTHDSIRGVQPIDVNLPAVGPGAFVRATPVTASSR